MAFTCPNCGETISTAGRVCPFCGFDKRAAASGYTFALLSGFIGLLLGGIVGSLAGGICWGAFGALIGAAVLGNAARLFAARFDE
jgi:Uncharacterised protein family UPF0547